MVDEPRDGSTAEPRYSRQLWLAVSRYAAPALAAIALVLVVAGDGPELDNDLHLIAPTIARPGSTLPIRALLYSQLRAVEGPVLAQQPIDVWLEAPGGHVLARTRLMAAASGSHDLEGLLALPTEPASLQLHARTRLGERDRPARSSAPGFLRVDG